MCKFKIQISSERDNLEFKLKIQIHIKGRLQQYGTLHNSTTIRKRNTHDTEKEIHTIRK